MARNRLSFFLLVLVGSLNAADDRIANTLAVQAALKQGREYLLRSDFQLAVQVLESQITRIEANATYLATLRDAYRGLIKALKFAHKDEEAAIYIRRLQILDPGSAIEFGAPKQSAPEPAPTVARGKIDDTPSKPAVDPFSVQNHRRYQEVQTLLDQADQLFKTEKYSQAEAIYSQIQKTMPEALGSAGERLAYCQMYSVVDRLNRPEKPSASEWPGLEQQVRQAMIMTPKLQTFGKTILATIETRRGEGGAASRAAPVETKVEETPVVEVKHSKTPGARYSVAESTNFRIFHNGDNAQAEVVAKSAESVRVAMQKKWFGKVSEPWTPKCDVYLHATADEYSKETGQAGNTPGHANLATQGERVVLRQLHLRLDCPTMLTSVLPHETTHVVLAGRFGATPIPRWADEGMAVLTEPRESVAKFTRNLPKHREAMQLFKMQDLLALKDWPAANQVGGFYAQSVSVVEYLCSLKGDQTFAAFLKEGLAGGMEPALKKYYDIDGTRDLETRWTAHAFRTGDGLAQRGE